MKKAQNSLLVALFAMFSIATFAQNSTRLGIKGGLNYNANGNYFESAGEAAKNPDRNIGYHLGLFGKFGDRLYFRPELVYTRTTTDYDGDKFKMAKLDAPMLIGAKIIGPLNLFAGPSFQYILDTEFEGISIDNVENDFTVGLNIGAGLNLGKFGIDLRYERGFSNNEAEFINTNITSIGPSRVDTRPDQLILSFSLSL